MAVAMWGALHVNYPQNNGAVSVQTQAERTDGTTFHAGGATTLAPAMVNQLTEPSEMFVASSGHTPSSLFSIQLMALLLFFFLLHLLKNDGTPGRITGDQRGSF